MKRKRNYVIILFIMFSLFTNGQMILIDKGQHVNDLWVFPSSTNTNNYYYLPSESILSKTKSGKPQFSFLRYVALKKAGEDSTSPVTEADGGAILHFLLEYNTPISQIKKAEEILREESGNNEIQIKAPVIFEEANFALISSIVVGGKDKKEVLTVSNAPVLEGGKMAFSFHLNTKNTKLLLESFKMDTPDVSITFQLKFAGYSDTFNAELIANWDKIYTHKQKKESKNLLFFKEEAFSDIKEMFSSGDIELKVMGDDAKSQKLIDNAYAKVLDLVYKPLDLKKFKENGTVDDLERAWESTVDGVLALQTFGLSSIGSTNGYEYREIKQSGKTHLTLSKSTKTYRNHFLTFNIGNLYKEYSQDESIFKIVNIIDPDYMQRDVFISLDGSLKNAFKDMVNSVNITVTKKHGNGEERTYSKRIDENSFDKPQAVAYGNRGDVDDSFSPLDMENWKKYEYEVIWDFKGGEQLTVKSDSLTSGDINLYIPYTAREIIFVGDINDIWNSGVKALRIDIRYDFFGGQRNMEPIILSNGEAIEKVQKYLAPLNNSSYEYRIIPILDNTKQHIDYQDDDDGVIVLDL